MFEVTISTNNRPIWYIQAQNDRTGDIETGNYDVEVYKVGRRACGRPDPKLATKFPIKGFKREYGALVLAECILTILHSADDILHTLQTDLATIAESASPTI